MATALSATFHVFAGKLIFLSCDFCGIVAASVAEDLSVRDKQGIDPPNRLKRATFDPSHGETLGVVFGLAFHHARKPMVNSDSLRASTTVLQTDLL